MADPVTVKLALEGLRRLMAQMQNDSEKLLRNIFICIAGSGAAFFMIILLILLPVAILINLPLILLGDFDSNSDDMVDYESMALFYENAGSLLEEDNNRWVEAMKTEYDFCHDHVIQIHGEFAGWFSVLAVDTILLDQDFSQVNREKILNTTRRFVKRDVIVKDHEEIIIITEVIEVRDTVYDDDGNAVEIISHIQKTREETTIKQIAVITITYKTMEEVLDNLGFRKDDREQVALIYENLQLLYLD